jgi:hypothetical protein
VKEADTLTRKVEALTKELQNAHADGETASKERDLLIAGKNSLTRKVDELLNDKDGLLKKRPHSSTSETAWSKTTSGWGKRSTF